MGVLLPKPKLRRKKSAEMCFIRGLTEPKRLLASLNRRGPDYTIGLNYPQPMGVVGLVVSREFGVPHPFLITWAIDLVID